MTERDTSPPPPGASSPPPDTGNPGSRETARLDRDYADALASVRHAIEQFDGCSEGEKAALAKDLAELEAISIKLEQGRVEIVLFGEIDTGKSALINALVGKAVADVDVRGGWTKEVWSTSWSGCGYVVPGFEQSQVILLDTPGINE
ncbi:MAG TPA: GTPase domain-containing protein, partial [Pirellulales bacterium]|nr:GTPase domain-containing protein [Pirellulales bacterium]